MDPREKRKKFDAGTEQALATLDSLGKNVHNLAKDAQANNSLNPQIVTALADISLMKHSIENLNAFMAEMAPLKESIKSLVSELAPKSFSNVVAEMGALKNNVGILNKIINDQAVITQSVPSLSACISNISNFVEALQLNLVATCQKLDADFTQQNSDVTDSDLDVDYTDSLT